MRLFFARPLPRPDFWLVGVLLLALALRVWGLTWGLPSATHYFSYHPDESIVLETSSLTMNVFAGRLLPHYYHYGSLQFYLVCFANTFAALAGVVDIAPKNFAVWYPQWAKMYLIGRCLTVGMGVGTVWAVYAIGRRLWGRRAGLLAALTLAITPLHAQHSHFLTVDVPATFWAMLSLLWAVRLATGDIKPLRAALWAGVFAGCAAATKYNLALVILPLAVACVVRTSLLAPNNGGTREEPNPAIRMAVPSLGGKGGGLVRRDRSSGSPELGWGGLFLAGFAAFALAFLLACPGAILESGTFFHDLRYEAVHVQNTDDPTFRDTGNGFVYLITRNLDAGLGLPLLLLSLVSVGYALYRRERGDGLLAAFALPYYVLIGLAAVRYARYDIPLLPILALWNGRILADGLRQPFPIQRRVVALSALIAIATVANTFMLIDLMAEPDTRDEALVWLNTYAPATMAVGFAAQPWFGTPPISPYFSLPRPGEWQDATASQIKSRIVYTGKDWDLKLLQSQKPSIVVLNEYDYDDPLRLHQPDAQAYMAYLRQNYKYGVCFSPVYRDTLIDGMPTCGLPHDMTYPSPGICIYSKNAVRQQRSE